MYLLTYQIVLKLFWMSRFHIGSSSFVSFFSLEFDNCPTTVSFQFKLNCYVFSPISFRKKKVLNVEFDWHTRFFIQGLDFLSNGSDVGFAGRLLDSAPFPLSTTRRRDSRRSSESRLGPFQRRRISRLLLPSLHSSRRLGHQSRHRRHRHYIRLGLEPSKWSPGMSSDESYGVWHCISLLQNWR